MKYVVTGATGFLGKRLVPELLRAGHDVVLIVRSHHAVTASERIYNHFINDGIEEHRERIVVIEGDITHDPDHLSDTISRHGDVQGVWHLAANLSFKPEHRAAVLADNLLGTKHVTQLCERLKAPLYFVSTAFVHGRRFGVIKDTELIRPRAFNNAYEESKFLCEEFIQEWGRSNEYLIFRPGILISLTPGEGSYFGYYVIAHALKKMRGRLFDQILRYPQVSSLLGFSYLDGVVRTPLIFPVTACSIDFVPVEWVVPWMRRLAEGSDRNTAFHVSNPHPIPMKQLVEVITRATKLKLVTYPSAYWLTNIYFFLLRLLGFLSPILASFSRKILPYQFYVTAQFMHDMSRTTERLGDLSQYTVSEQTLFDIAVSYVRNESDRKAP